jgi:hypothetical protein
MASADPMIFRGKWEFPWSIISGVAQFMHESMHDERGYPLMMLLKRTGKLKPRILERNFLLYSASLLTALKLKVITVDPIALPDLLYTENPAYDPNLS